MKASATCKGKRGVRKVEEKRKGGRIDKGKWSSRSVEKDGAEIEKKGIKRRDGNEGDKKGGQRKMEGICKECGKE